MTDESLAEQVRREAYKYLSGREAPPSPGAATIPKRRSQLSTTRVDPEIAKYQELASSDDLALAQSARRVLAKLNAPPTLEVLKTAVTMRALAAGGDASARLLAMSWLHKHGLQATETAPVVDRKTEKLTGRIVAISEKGRREGWSKSRIQAEALKVVDAEMAKARRSR